MRKICVITGTRADYGLLQWVMAKIKLDKSLKLQVIATGMHLSPEHGNTYTEIINDGFKIDFKVENLLNSDTAVGVSKSVGLGVIGFADAYNILKPDLILLLGDRFEILSAATAALIGNCPIAHLHGGETTEGAFDEAIRHSITKMSQIHFVSNEIYRNRVLQLGEDPSYTFISGGLGVDAITKTKLYNKKDLERELDFKFYKKNLLITFHPETLEKDHGINQLDELLLALDTLTDTGLIFTMPNADTGGKEIGKRIIKYVSTKKNAAVYKSLGQKKYLSCIKYTDAVVGNSSSALAESPTFKKGSINIGDRQKGRLKASSVIDCQPNKTSILSAISKLYSKSFTQNLINVENPYGNGGASEFIVKIIKKVQLEKITKKKFNDFPQKKINK